MRTSGIRLLERVTAGYIALFQGTPLLMQLFVVYYGLALYGVKLDAWVAVAIGFTLHASAYLGEIWRGAIEAVPRGQVEAAQGPEPRLRLAHEGRGPAAGVPHLAAGDHRLSGAADQGNLAGGVRRLHRTGPRRQAWSRTRSSSRCSSSASSGIIYFVICWPLSLYGTRLERRFAAAAR